VRGNKPLLEIIIVTSFCLFLALLLFFARWNGFTPFPFLHGDAANIAGFAAAFDHPELFKGDGVLGDPKNFRLYSVLQVHLVRLLAKLTGDYGTATVILLIPYVFLQLIGFYWLGRVLFASRYWAILLSLTNFVFVNLPYSYWGISADPQPRMAFQAVLPFLLLATYRWRGTPKAWLWLLIGAGLLVYVHPVGGFVWGPTLWLGFWLFLPKAWALPKRLTFMFLVGIAFAAAVSPYLIHYFQNHAFGRPPIDSDIVYQIMGQRLRRGYVDIPFALANYLLFWLYPPRALLLIMAVIGPWVIVLRHKYPGKGSLPFLVGIWSAGILLFSAVIPLVEQSIEKSLGLVPTQIDLIRGLRFLVPLVLMMCFWTLVKIYRLPDQPSRFQSVFVKEFTRISIAAFPSVVLALFAIFKYVLHGEVLWKEIRNQLEQLAAKPTLGNWSSSMWQAATSLRGEMSVMIWAALSMAALVFVIWIIRRCWARFPPEHVGLWIKHLAYLSSVSLLIVWAGIHYSGSYPPGSVFRQVGCWVHGQHVCAEDGHARKEAVYQELLAIARCVPPKAPVLATHNTLAIRYVALRPVVYSYKDGGILSYTNPVALVEWYCKHTTMQRILKERDPAQRLRELLEYAKTLSVQYIIVQDVPLGIIASMPEVELLWPKESGPEAGEIAILKASGN